VGGEILDYVVAGVHFGVPGVGESFGYYGIVRRGATAENMVSRGVGVGEFVGVGCSVGEGDGAFVSFDQPVECLREERSVSVFPSFV
jgi:hypothetical protein